ncbi:hypothetical protein G3I76_12575, partial [Streptomyces sp. SID11233]|nr:hypothetical protein [Streptomyces sp. SID11233]
IMVENEIGDLGEVTVTWNSPIAVNRSMKSLSGINPVKHDAHLASIMCDAIIRILGLAGFAAREAEDDMNPYLVSVSRSK